jgi:hypothetical protein
LETEEKCYRCQHLLPFRFNRKCNTTYRENDGIFDNDYILFYAEGIDTYNVESQTYNNLYDSKSYYYITTSGGDGKGLRTQTNPMEAAT